MKRKKKTSEKRARGEHTKKSASHMSRHENNWKHHRTTTNAFKCTGKTGIQKTIRVAKMQTHSIHTWTMCIDHNIIATYENIEVFNNLDIVIHVHSMLIFLLPCHHTFMAFMYRDVLALSIKTTSNKHNVVYHIHDVNKIHGKKT